MQGISKRLLQVVADVSDKENFHLRARQGRAALRACRLRRDHEVVAATTSVSAARPRARRRPKLRSQAGARQK